MELARITCTTSFVKNKRITNVLKIACQPCKWCAKRNSVRTVFDTIDKCLTILEMANAFAIIKFESGVIL